jgi:simple sugar transport system ATP-binding protein
MQIQNRFLWKGSLEILGLKHGSEIKTHVDALIKELDIRCVKRKQRVGSLSGGNQQKVCFARALTLMPEILLVSEPTRGVDIGAKKLILDKIVDLNETFGMTIVLTSSELMELRSVCDRIAIVSEGKICRILDPDASAHDFGLALAGTSHHSGHA